MPSYTATQLIAASPDRVFEVVAHVDNFKEAIPHIVEVEFLTDVTRGVGTRFRETRLMRGREATTELEVTEYVPSERVRLVSDAGGTIWDSVFTLSPDGEGTRLNLTMEARPYRWPARLSVPIIGGMLRKALQADMDAVKEHLEGESTD